MKHSLIVALLILSNVLIGQSYENEPSDKFPFGKPHAAAPDQIKDFEPMIGTCQCKSVTRIDQNTWADTVAMTWTFKYIMNGWGVQDETLKADGRHSGSIRIYNQDSARWYVHYYASVGSTAPLGVWEGNREEGKIVLYRKQPAPNGMEGFYRLTFSDFTENGYNWIGEWVDAAETFSYPTWKIFCRREE